MSPILIGDSASAQLNSPKELIESTRLAAIRQRMQAYLKAIHAETKPLRPGTPKGGTLESAAEAAEQLKAEIYGE